MRCRLPTVVATDHSLLELDGELDALLDRIQDEIEEQGEASVEAMERFQLFGQGSLSDWSVAVEKLDVRKTA